MRHQMGRFRPKNRCRKTWEKARWKKKFERNRKQFDAIIKEKMGIEWYENNWKAY